MVDRAAALNALADRVESEGPSRELDCRIQASFDDMAAERLRDPSASFNVIGIHTEGETWAANYRVLHYTSSLDAAVSLVRWCISHLSEIGADGLPLAILTDGAREARGMCLHSPTSGVTALARALTAAALRAIAQAPHQTIARES
ncbi:MAG: hypothetical protein ACOY4R_27380 [Pseudomonadota bacterium]